MKVKVVVLALWTVVGCSSIRRETRDITSFQFQEAGGSVCTCGKPSHSPPRLQDLCE